MKQLVKLHQLKNIEQINLLTAELGLAATKGKLKHSLN
jgi:hypothetical protein